MIYTNYDPTPSPKYKQAIIGPPNQLLYDMSRGWVEKYNIEQPKLANVLNTGVMRALTQEPKSNYIKYPTLAFATHSFKMGSFVAYQGTNRVSTNIATTPAGGTATAGTVSDGSDADGAAKDELQGAAGAYPRRNVTTFNIAFATKFGIYVNYKFKFPTTGGQTNLTDRLFRMGMYSTVPGGTADPAGSFMEIILNQGTYGGNFMLRTKDGTTASNVDTGVSAALDTLYIAEVWSLNGLSVYARINGVTVVKTSNLPNSGTALNVGEYLFGMTTDQGDTVLRSYGGCNLGLQ